MDELNVLIIIIQGSRVKVGLRSGQDRVKVVRVKVIYRRVPASNEIISFLQFFFEAFVSVGGCLYIDQLVPDYPRTVVIDEAPQISIRH